VDESESWTTAEIEPYQLGPLKKVVRHAYENSTAYRKLLNRRESHLARLSHRETWQGCRSSQKRIYVTDWRSSCAPGPDAKICDDGREHRDPVEAIHRKICTNSLSVRHISILNAEIAKVDWNVFVNETSAKHTV
jgi:hypothetical protein